MIGEAFPTIRYDGGLTTSVWSVTRADTPSKFDIGEVVYILTASKDVVSGIVETPPTTLSTWYTIRLENGETMVADPNDIYTEYNVPATGSPSETLGFFTPDWLQQDAKVTILHEDKYVRGYMQLDDDSFWEFVTRGTDGKVQLGIPLPDLAYSWKSRLQENILQLGW